MQASEIINRVRKELVETIGSFWSDAELLELLNKAEKVMLGDSRLLEDTANLDLEAGITNYPLPENWLSARALFVNDASSGSADWKRLRATSLEKISQEVPNLLDSSTSKRGCPSRYWLWGREIYFDASPDTNYQVSMYYKSKPVKIVNTTDDINLDDSLADGLEAYMLWKAWKKEKETELALEARAEFDEWIRKARRFEKKQAGDKRNRIDIESSDAFSGGSNIS